MYHIFDTSKTLCRTVHVTREIYTVMARLTSYVSYTNYVVKREAVLYSFSYELIIQANAKFLILVVSLISAAYTRALLLSFAFGCL